jgi:hypothetical protein
MKAFKYLVVIAALVVVGGMVADSWAQCSPGRVFRSSGPQGNNIQIDVAGSENDGHQIGYHWDSDNANNSNSGFAPNYGFRCPVADWWVLKTAPTFMRINGVQGAGTCIGAQMGCPANKLSIVVEDYQAGFPPPGVGGTAYYAAFMVNETPASGRWYDYGAMDGLPDESNIPMLPYPDAVITGSSRSGATISVSYQNLDQTNMVHTTNWPGGVFPTSAVISEWQLVKATGTADPGRARANGWVTIQTTPYVPGGAPNAFVVPCSSTATDEYLAIAIGFNGGAYGVIDSALVGRAIPLECDPNLAQPDTPVNLDRKPSATQIDPKPLRSGGRR